MEAEGLPMNSKKKTFILSEFEAFQRAAVRSAVRSGELRDIMEYSLYAGGKRFRPLLLMETFFALHAGNDDLVRDVALTVATAIECIHTYSLIHDDLPCMDDDDFRRGLPTSHRKFGEAEALLAGDALLNLGFELMTDAYIKSGDIGVARAVRYIGNCTGANGMVFGQYLDIRNQGDLGLEELRTINAHKTGALIRAAVVAGAMIARADERTVQIAEKIGDLIGMIFQITDDLIDMYSSREEAGKSVRSDSDMHKSTYPALLGDDGVQRILYDLVRQAEDLAEESGMLFVRTIVKQLIGRKK